jgi:deoxyribodipyrimidine photo-lyase
MPQHLVWLRTDLRILDNPALFSAAESGHVTALFLLTPKQWQVHGIAPRKIAFILRSLDTVSEQLAERGIETKIILSSRFDDAPQQVLEVAKATHANSVFWNNEIAIDEQRRDDAVAQTLSEAGIHVERHHAFTSLPPGSVRKPDASFYSVFTPFKKRWIGLCIDRGIQTFPIPEPQGPKVPATAAPDTVGNVAKSLGNEQWPAGEREGLKLLDRFIDSSIHAYDDQRDLPDLEGTSKLSPHLAAGTLSASHCIQAAYACNGHRLSGGNSNIDTWISELIWREFYNHILVEHPRLAMGRAFKSDTDLLPWNHSREQLERWQRGETGFPFVDAGMRQLNATGWMHNRLRMVTAQFLAKHLFLDWRLGEAYFMSQLVDGDFAANNGGWQWSASTGTDAVPYFRMFNPVRQAERFDPQGTFVRRMIPELAEASPKQTLEPWKFGGVGNYPAPMIDLGKARDRTLAIWKQARAK